MKSKLKKILALSISFAAIATPVAVFFATGGTLEQLDVAKEVLSASVVSFLTGTGGTALVYYLVTSRFGKTENKFNDATSKLVLSNDNLNKLITENKTNNVDLKTFIKNEITNLIENELKPLNEKTNEALNKTVLLEDELKNSALRIVSELTEGLSEDKVKEV